MLTFLIRSATSSIKYKDEMRNRNSWDEYFLRPVVQGAISCGQKSFKLVWRCHQLLSEFLAKGYYLCQDLDVTTLLSFEHFFISVVYGQNIFKLVWRCHQLLSGFLGNDKLSPEIFLFKLNATGRMMMQLPFDRASTRIPMWRKIFWLQGKH